MDDGHAHGVPQPGEKEREKEARIRHGPGCQVDATRRPPHRLADEDEEGEHVADDAQYGHSGQSDQVEPRQDLDDHAGVMVSGKTRSVGQAGVVAAVRLYDEGGAVVQAVRSRHVVDAIGGGVVDAAEAEDGGSHENGKSVCAGHFWTARKFSCSLRNGSVP